jgi:hypothetical protein
MKQAARRATYSSETSIDFIWRCIPEGRNLLNKVGFQHSWKQHSSDLIKLAQEIERIVLHQFRRLLHGFHSVTLFSKAVHEIRGGDLKF